MTLPDFRRKLAAWQKTPQRGVPTTKLKPSPLLDTRVVYCGDNLGQLGPCRTGQCWGETKEKRAFEDRHESTRAYIDYMRPHCRTVKQSPQTKMGFKTPNEAYY